MVVLDVQGRVVVCRLYFVFVLSDLKNLVLNLFVLFMNKGTIVTPEYFSS